MPARISEPGKLSGFGESKSVTVLQQTKFLLSCFFSPWKPANAISNSTLTPILQFNPYIDFNEALDDGKEARAVLCDVSKAFDGVWLRHKHSSTGIPGPIPC